MVLSINHVKVSRREGLEKMVITGKKINAKKKKSSERTEISGWPDYIVYKEKAVDLKRDVDDRAR